LIRTTKVNVLHSKCIIVLIYAGKFFINSVATGSGICFNHIVKLLPVKGFRGMVINILVLNLFPNNSSNRIIRYNYC